MQNDSFKRIACNNVLASTPPFLMDMFCSLYSYVSYRVLNQLITAFADYSSNANLQVSFQTSLDWAALRKM